MSDHIDIHDLYALVRDLPREATPSSVVGYNLERGYVIVAVPEMGSKCVHEDRFMAPYQAVGMFEASLLKYMARDGQTVRVWHCGDHWHADDREASDVLLRALVAVWRDRTKLAHPAAAKGER